MFKIETENLILRDMVEADIEKHMYWFTTETEWWNWDAAYWYFQELTGNKLNKEIATDKSLGKGFCIGHSYFCERTTIRE